LRKIVITGPESSGKSTLALELANSFKAAHTEEQARAYLTSLGEPYVFDDLLKIAEQQIQTEDKFNEEEYDLLFCDTDLITIKIWSLEKYSKISSKILEWINNRSYDLYLLCRPDIAWEADPLRENPFDRERLFEKHQDELIHYQKNFEIIEGLGEERLNSAVKIIENYQRFWGT